VCVVVDGACDLYNFLKCSWNGPRVGVRACERLGLFLCSRSAGPNSLLTWPRIHASQLVCVCLEVDLVLRVIFLFDWP
jgi:hypothetical protein